MKSRTFITDDVYGFIHEGPEFPFADFLKNGKHVRRPSVYGGTEKRQSMYVSTNAVCICPKSETDY